MQSDSPNSAKVVLTPASHSTKPGIVSWLSENRIRLFKFASVGASGVVVNLLVFELCLYMLQYTAFSDDLKFAIANSIGIIVSILTNFILNDLWTWSDRSKGTLRNTFARLAKYYVAASAVGLIQLSVSWLSFTLLWSQFEIRLYDLDLSPRIAVFTGIGVAMFFNFAASHLWTFRDIDSE